MGGDENLGREDPWDVEETICVTVGKSIKERSTLEWALQNFPGKKICILHVHRPPLAAPFDRKFLAYKLKPQAAKASQELEKRKMHKLLNEYRQLLAQEGQGSTAWIEMDSVEKGIIEFIKEHNVRWLVMGAAADKHYSKLMENAELMSTKAKFVKQQAPMTCHIWFVCNRILIYTRRATVSGTRKGLTENSDTEIEGLKNPKQEYCELEPASTPSHVWQERSTDSHSQFENFTALSNKKGSMGMNAGEEPDGQKRNSCSETFPPQCPTFSSSCCSKVNPSLTDDATSPDRSCEAISHRKGMEDMPSKGKQEADLMKDQHVDLMKELRLVQEQMPNLESRIVDSRYVEKDLEEKIFSAVKLLIDFKERRDELRLENENAIRELNRPKNLVVKDAASSLRPQFLELSFLEIFEATQQFDPSQKLGDGRFGNVYKGSLLHMQVAIKMLPSFGSQDCLDFKHKAELLSRVRHPNLVSLVGSCPESGSLVYEYLKNGSLEDRLACSTPAFSWKFRTQIATDICSVLIFLQSNDPCIVHGNLKPSKVLFDSNFVCKVSDLAILEMLPHVSHMRVDPEFAPRNDVYSFGMILLRLLTGRSLAEIRNFERALDKHGFNSVLDFSAGDWPLELATDLIHMALRCCENSQSNQLELLLQVMSVLKVMSASSPSSYSHLVSKENHRAPGYFVCPIFQEVMKDPRICSDGFTYEAEAIEEWFKSGHDTSPMTNLKLEDCNLHPNHALHYAILDYMHRH